MEEMTDTQREQMFDEIKARTIKSLLGDAQYEVKPDLEFTEVDENFGTSTTMYDAPRVHKDMNPRMDKGGYTPDMQIRDRNGYIVVKDDSPLEMAAPEPIK